MKPRSIVTAAIVAFSFLASVGSAQASPDFTATNGLLSNMNVAPGNSGNVFKPVFPQTGTVVFGTEQGSLAPSTFVGGHDKLVLTYTLSNMVTLGDLTLSASGTGGNTFVSTEDPSANSHAGLVFASANLGPANPTGTTTGTITLYNFSNAVVNFTASIAAQLGIHTRGVTLTYAVSQVPLPAALPMFAAAVFGLFGLARYRKHKGSMAAA